jgi:hypothetical protein
MHRADRLSVGDRVIGAICCDEGLVGEQIDDGVYMGVNLFEPEQGSSSPPLGSIFDAYGWLAQDGATTSRQGARSPSGKPKAQARPPLVVAIASKPAASNWRALMASQALGRSNSGGG